MRGLGWGPLSSSSCRNGSRGALGLGLLQWLSHNNGLVPSAIEGWASLRFPFLFRYWRQIWPVLVLARRSQVPSRWHRDGGKCGRSPIQTFPRHLDQTGGNMRRDSVVVFVGGGGGWGLFAAFVLGLGLVSFLLARVSCIPAWVGVGVGATAPCLSAWLSGCSQATSKCTPRPRAPGSAQAQGQLPWAGSMLGLLRRVLHQVLWSEALPFLLFFHRPHRHRISKEEARSEAEPEGRPASALSTEPLPWDSDQRTTGPRARH